MKITQYLSILVIIVIVKNTEEKQSCEEVLMKIQKIMNNNSGKVSCEKGWIKWRNSCYFFSTEKRTWTESESYCKKHGSHLVKVDDDRENQWLYSKTRKGSHILWLGATDIKKEGEWIWAADNTKLSYQPWDSSYHEPNGKTRENCLNLIGSDHRGRRHWNDHRCTYPTYYVCEKTKN